VVRTLLLLIACLLTAAPSVAQTTPTPATPARVDLLVLPATGDPATVAPVATSSVAVGMTAPACNQTPAATPAPASLVNPTQPWEFADPFRAGRVCHIALPAGLADGNYRVVAVAVADSCNPTGKQVITPCASPRSSVGLPPFSIVTPILPPAAPTGLRSTQ